MHSQHRLNCRTLPCRHPQIVVNIDVNSWWKEASISINWRPAKWDVTCGVHIAKKDCSVSTICFISVGFVSALYSLFYNKYLLYCKIACFLGCVQPDIHHNALVILDIPTLLLSMGIYLLFCCFHFAYCPFSGILQIWCLCLCNGNVFFSVENRSRFLLLLCEKLHYQCLSLLLFSFSLHK